MFTAIVSGRVHAAPETRTARNGKPFTCARLIVSTDGGNMLVNLIAFDAMSDALAQLVTSAEVRVKGSARLNQWTRGDEVCAGINVVVESMTALDAAPRRKDHRPTERQTRRWARA